MYLWTLTRLLFEKAEKAVLGITGEFGYGLDLT